jgi:Cu-Zn family superoxide dismutase
MVKPAALTAALLALPVAVMSACATTQQGTNQSSTTSSASTTPTQPPGTQRLTTQLKTADGRPVANATLDFANGYATITVETVGNHILSPGFHGMHIHAVGKCEANSVAPTGGQPGDFNSAGGHFQVPGHTGNPQSGDLTSLEVRSDGSAKLVTTSDAFTATDLLAGQQTALIIHQDPDNFGNIPPRYTQPNGAPGPDQETLATGDAGKRVACGVIGSASATETTTSTTVPTVVVVPTTTQTPVTTGGLTTTESTTPPSTNTSTSTSTSTVTVTAPTLTPYTPTVPGPTAPGPAG